MGVEFGAEIIGRAGGRCGVTLGSAWDWRSRGNLRSAWEIAAGPEFSLSPAARAEALAPAEAAGVGVAAGAKALPSKWGWGTVTDRWNGG